MANFLVKESTNWVDAKGHYAHIRFYASLDSNNDGSALLSAFVTETEAITNAVYNGGLGVGNGIQIPGTYGVQADYGSAEDKALFTFVDSGGNIHRYQVPAPKAAIFYADGETVNPANGLVAAWVNVMTNFAANAYFISSRDGEPLSTFVGGIRLRRRMQRRLNIFIKNPAETGPAE